MRGPTPADLLQQIQKISPAAGRVAEDLATTIGRSYQDEIQELRDRNNELAKEANDAVNGRVEQIDAARSLLSAGLPCDPDMSLGDMINLALRSNAEAKNTYAADLERIAYELHNALGLSVSTEKYEGYKDWAAWWKRLMEKVAEYHSIEKDWTGHLNRVRETTEAAKDALSDGFGIDRVMALPEMVKRAVETYRGTRGQIEVQASAIADYDTFAMRLRSLHQTYFAGTEWAHEEGTELLDAIEKAYGAASHAMAKEVVAKDGERAKTSALINEIRDLFVDHFGSKGKFSWDGSVPVLEQLSRVFLALANTPKRTMPSDVTVEQLTAMYQTAQEELTRVTDTAIERGEKLTQALRDWTNETRRSERLALALKHEQQRRKQEQARAEAMILVATEEALEPPTKYDYSWSPGIDVIGQLRRISEMRLDGWQRFERETGRLQLENDVITKTMKRKDERIKELEEFVSRAALSDQSDITPGPSTIPTSAYCKDPSCSDATDGPHVHFPLADEGAPASWTDGPAHSHVFGEECANWCVARGGCGDPKCEHAPDGGQHPAAATS